MSYQAPYNQAPNQAPYNGSIGSDPTAHRDANTTMPQQPAMRPPRGRIPALALGAYAAGVLGVVLAAVTLALFLMYKGQAQTQLHQVRQALATTQTSLAKAQSRDDTRYTKLVGTVSNIGNALAPYSMICSTDLQGQAGPAQYWFACSDTKP
jgi:hypothetical protein